MEWSGATFLVVRSQIWRSKSDAGGEGRMAEWEWDCSKRWLGILPVEEFLVEFWRWISICRISLARS
jgi:hypothetical protein